MWMIRGATCGPTRSVIRGHITIQNRDMAMDDPWSSDHHGLSERLTRDWGLLSLSNDIARWALQRVHAVGRYEVIAIDRWWPQPIS